MKNRLQNWHVLFFKFFEHKSLLFRILASLFCFLLAKLIQLKQHPEEQKIFLEELEEEHMSILQPLFHKVNVKLEKNEFTKSLLNMIKSRIMAHFFHSWISYSYGKFVISKNSSNMCFSMLHATKQGFPLFRPLLYLIFIQVNFSILD